MFKLLCSRQVHHLHCKLLWFMVAILDLCMCEDHAATKTKSEVTVKMACRPLLNHKQAAITTDESDKAKEPNRVSHVCVHSLQTAVPLRGHHSAQYIWSPAQMRRHFNAEVMFVPTPLLNATEDTVLVYSKPRPYQSFSLDVMLLNTFCRLTQ